MKQLLIDFLYLWFEVNFNSVIISRELAEEYRFIGKKMAAAILLVAVLIHNQILI